MSLLSELIGDRAHRLKEPCLADVQQRIVAAMAEQHDPDLLQQVAFHLLDWSPDAAFLVALALFPERFTDEEIATGVINLLIHAPNHLAAAAKLAGYPIEDTFEVDALSESRDNVANPPPGGCD